MLPVADVLVTVEVDCGVSNISTQVSVSNCAAAPLRLAPGDMTCWHKLLPCRLNLLLLLLNKTQRSRWSDTAHCCSE